MTKLGTGTLTVRWRMVPDGGLRRTATLSDELWQARQPGSGEGRAADLVVLVDGPPRPPTLFAEDGYFHNEPIREQANAYTIYTKSGSVTRGDYFWTDCPGCGGLAWRGKGWAGGCPLDPPLGDEFVYAHDTPRLMAAYAAATLAAGGV